MRTHKMTNERILSYKLSQEFTEEELKVISGGSQMCYGGTGGFCFNVQNGQTQYDANADIQVDG